MWSSLYISTKSTFMLCLKQSSEKQTRQKCDYKTNHHGERGEANVGKM